MIQMCDRGVVIIAVRRSLVVTRRLTDGELQFVGFFFALWRSSGGELRAVSCVFEAGVVRGLILPAVPQSTAVYQINRAA